MHGQSAEDRGDGKCNTFTLLLCVTSMQWIMTALHCNRRYYVFVVCGDTAVLLLLLLLLLMLSESFFLGVVKIRHTHQSTSYTPSVRHDSEADESLEMVEGFQVPVTLIACHKDCRQ